jgi:hypothetical protein
MGLVLVVAVFVLVDGIFNRDAILVTCGLAFGAWALSRIMSRAGGRARG